LTELTSRPATQADEEAIAKLLLCMYEEVGRAPLNVAKALHEVADTVRNHACFIVEHNGLVVGSAGINPLIGGLFYSDAPFLIDKWFYVARPYRPENLDAAAFKLLLAEIKHLVDTVGIPCFVRVFNEKRVRVRDSLDAIGRAYACYPAGANIEIHPGNTRH
jgi:hypothetical protein